MRGSQIGLLLLVLMSVSLGYLLWPSESDVRAQFDKGVPHRRQAAVALKDCADHIQYLQKRKQTSQKKIELGKLRTQHEKLTDEAKKLLEEDDIEQGLRVQRLKDLEGESWEHMRDCEDLRARLAEMRSFSDQLTPVIQKLGRIMHQLTAAQNQSVDVEFQQRAADLFQKSKVARGLTDRGMITLSRSISEGRPLATAGLRDLQEAVKLMQDLLDSQTDATQ